MLQSLILHRLALNLFTNMKLDLNALMTFRTASLFVYWLTGIHISRFSFRGRGWNISISLLLFGLASPAIYITNGLGPLEDPMCALIGPQPYPQSFLLKLD